jgi:4-hydroxymandelate oxidase
MKTWEEICQSAREKVYPHCKVCLVCDGMACKNAIPGPGSIGNASSWVSCTKYLNNIKLNMDTIYESRGQDTALSIFGKTLRYPILLAPIGGMGLNYGGPMTDKEFMDAAVDGAIRAGILAFTGDGPVPGLFQSSIDIMRQYGGNSVSTFKPWSNERLLSQRAAVEAAGGTSFAMDIDSAGFANMGSLVNSVSPKSVKDLKILTNGTNLPFVLKGIMTVAGAKKAIEAGAYGIVVSTHGGRVISDAPATCQMVYEIRQEVGDSIKIIVDGGIRTGKDIFKALALGADAVMIGRPYAIAAIGGGAEGVQVLTEKLGTELKNVMLMCGAAKLSDISLEMIRMNH